MARYQAGKWMAISPPHGRPVIGKPQPPPKRKTRATKPKRRKRRSK
jgi:hypothetical protein